MVSYHDAELLAQKDALSLNENAQQYVADNNYQYYLLVNTWVSITTAHTPIGGKMLEDVIREFGVIPVIADASTLALNVVRPDVDVIDIDVREVHSPYDAFVLIIQGLDIGDALQVLRFPKRFTIKSGVLSSNSERKFKEANNRMCLVNRRCDRGIDDFLTSHVRTEVNYILPPLCKVDGSPHFTNGASHYGMRSYRSKYDKIKYYECDNFFGSPLYGKIRLTRPRSIFRDCKLAQVPKSYKTYRTIAVETVTNQSRQQSVRCALESALNKVARYAPLHNQAINGVTASDLDMATIDMSSASDSVSVWVVYQLLRDRPAWINAIMDTRSEVVQYPDGSRDMLHMAATMGNGFCFALETLIFLSIARAAVKVACRFLGKKWCADLVHSYGDDLIVPVWAYETVTEWLQRFGFLVNDDKSFAVGLFRESCGFDWFEGQYVSSTYWPREYISRSASSMPSVVSLQNRLFERGSGTRYYDACSFLRTQVLKVVPTLSTVPLSVYLEYRLDGRCLVGPLGRVEHRLYACEWSLVPGDGRPYQEERLYANLLTPVKKEVATRTSVDDLNVEMYYFSRFLHDGPNREIVSTAFGDVVTPLPLRDKDLTLITSGDFIVARTRLI